MEKVRHFKIKEVDAALGRKCTYLRRKIDENRKKAQKNELPEIPLN